MKKTVIVAFTLFFAVVVVYGLSIEGKYGGYFQYLKRTMNPFTVLDYPDVCRVRDFTFADGKTLSQKICEYHNIDPEGIFWGMNDVSMVTCTTKTGDRFYYRFMFSDSGFHADDPENEKIWEPVFKGDYKYIRWTL